MLAQTGADSVILPVPDSLNDIHGAVQDSIARRSDSLLSSPWKDSVSRRPVHGGWEPSTDSPLFIQVLNRHPFYHFSATPVAIRSDRREVQGKELLFYVLAGLLLWFALLKQAFGKYLSDLFRVFFRTTMKQRQIREQLMQTPLPSLLFNIFFVASAGLYADILLHYFRLTPVADFWLLYLYCCAGLALIYLGKYIGLKIAGWLFNMQKAADSYIFIVFIINKIIGIFLLPVLVLLAFAGEPVYSVSLVLSWCGIGGLLIYRFISGYAAVRNEVRFNLFHFLLYTCAAEVAPLLLIGKLLLLFFK